jgi:hypothetical protein
VLAAQLKEWIKIKRERGHIPPSSEAARAGLSRYEQFEGLEEFLLKLLGTALQTAPVAQPSQ